MTEQALWTIIFCLISVIVGGAGGAALFRKILKIPDPPANMNGDAATIAATAAASAAASTAASFRTELNEHMRIFEKQLDANTQKLSALDITVAGFTGACLERHKAIDRRLELVEEK